MDKLESVRKEKKKSTGTMIAPYGIYKKYFFMKNLYKKTTSYW